jgi:hypothetical protein
MASWDDELTDQVVVRQIDDGCGGHWLRLVADTRSRCGLDELAQAKEGSRGAGGHGVMVAAAGRPGQVWCGAARQAIAPAGISSGVSVLRLQTTRLRVWLCRPSCLRRLSFCLNT